MRAVVTGGLGFLGTRLVRYLGNSGVRVTVVDRPSGEASQESVPGAEAVLAVDLSSGAHPDLVAACERADVVFHLAAVGVDPRPRPVGEVLEQNIRSTLAVAEAAQKGGAGRVVYCGSCFEYGEGAAIREDAPLVPRSEYAASKASSWLYLLSLQQRGKLAAVAVRPFGVYGPGENVSRLFPSVALGCLRGEEVLMTEGNQVRDFVHVDDVASALLSAALRGVPGRVYNACTGIPTTIRATAEAIAAAVGIQGRFRFGAIPHREAEAQTLWGNPERSRTELGWQARGLETGLREVRKWFTEAPPAPSSNSASRCRGIEV